MTCGDAHGVGPRPYKDAPGSWRFTYPRGTSAVSHGVAVGSGGAGLEYWGPDRRRFDEKCYIKLEGLIEGNSGCGTVLKKEVRVRYKK